LKPANDDAIGERDELRFIRVGIFPQQVADYRAEQADDRRQLFITVTHDKQQRRHADDRDDAEQPEYMLRRRLQAPAQGGREDQRYARKPEQAERQELDDFGCPGLNPLRGGGSDSGLVNAA
jgi:hypothetical protein